MNVPFLRPRGCPIGVDPAEWRQALTERVEQLAKAMNDLINALDQMDGDPDLELSGDEMDVSSPEGRWWSFDTSVLDDSEDEDPAEDDGIVELSLGAPEVQVAPAFWSGMTRTEEGDQTRWAAGSNRVRLDDAEVENEHGGDVLDVPHFYAESESWPQIRS